MITYLRLNIIFLQSLILDNADVSKHIGEERVRTINGYANVNRKHYYITTKFATNKLAWIEKNNIGGTRIFFKMRLI